MTTPEIDTLNRFMVGGAGGGRLVLLNPPPGPITPDEALVLAAWLVAMSGKELEDFVAVLEAVEAT